MSERMGTVDYRPEPIDTSDVRLPEDLLGLVEHLAENVHEHWARQRLAEGWRLGPQRDQFRREHPCLVPYAELPEEEKRYDRQTAIETLKAIVQLGYQIRRESAP